MFTVQAKKEESLSFTVKAPKVRLSYFGAGRKSYHEDKRRQAPRTQKAKEW
jgi:hypothetical protein